MPTISIDTLFRTRPEPFICFAEDGRVLEANPAWRDFCAEVLHFTFDAERDLFSQLPPSMHACRQALAHQSRPSPTPCQLRQQMITSAPNQGQRAFTLTLAPLLTQDSALSGWSLLIHEETGNNSGVVQPPFASHPVQLLPNAEQQETNDLLAKEIAERKQAEENLQESKDRLTQIIHGNSIPTFVIDQNHRITHWNKALERLTGISSAETVGTSDQWKAFYSYERPTMADLILDQAKEEKICQFYSDKYIRSELLEDSYEVEDYFDLKGKSIWLLFTAAPIKSRSGALIGAVETLQDITRRKTMEQEILSYQTILENKVEERTLQLKKTYEQLLHAEKLSAVGKLAASIAHEFGNPIIGIRNFLKGIQMTTAFDQDDAELLQLAITECQRVKDLISNLQNFNRPTSGAMAPMDLHQAINDLLLFCKKGFKEKRIVVRKRFAPHLPMINAVHDQIKQVILNCLNNAQEAIPDHGGSIHLTTEDTGQAVLLHIQDTGKGINESDMVYIFEPFFSTKPAVEGTGLGLSVSYGIMKRHHGRIEVSETSNHGTTFTLSFPISPSEGS
jgi:PAS domain S-box-containing protein